MNSPNNRLNEKFQALADNTRREILALLKKSSLSAGEISNHFTISSASISYHLKKLESSGIITFEKFGKYRKY